MKKIILIAIFLVAGLYSCIKETPEIKKMNCFTEIDSTTTDQNIFNKWILVGYIENGEVCKPDSIPEIFVEFADSTTFHGFDGCNGFDGKYKLLNNNEMNVIHIVGTLIYCIDPINFWENKFLDGLKEAKDYKIKGEKLTIKNITGYSLVLKKE